jgi:hypothetical protein
LSVLAIIRGAVLGTGVGCVIACDDRISVSEPAVALTLSTQAVTVAEGSNASVTITLVRTNFLDDVALAVGALPPGLSASFSPKVLANDVVASVLTFAVAPGTGAAQADVLVQGTSSPGVGATASVAVTIAATTRQPLNATGF